MKPMAWAWMPISALGTAKQVMAAEPKRDEMAKETPAAALPSSDAAGEADD